MKPQTALSLVALALIQPGMTDTAEAINAGPGYGMEVLVGGRNLQEYPARGKRYIEALEQTEYTIRLSNPTGQRVAVALSVDGLNTIDAKHTSAEEAAKWVLAPYQTLEIRGWQTSDATSRAFYFTSEDAAYGTWIGQTANLGVISAAFFPEVVPTVYRQESESWFDSTLEGWGLGDNRAGEAAMESAPSASGAKRDMAAKPQAAPVSKSLAATGIGREQRNRVTTVAMELSSHPAATVSLRYEYHQELVRLGVFPREIRPLERREVAEGFAPDPYRGW